MWTLPCFAQHSWPPERDCTGPFRILEPLIPLDVVSSVVMAIRRKKPAFPGTVGTKHTKSTEVRSRMTLVSAGLKGWKMHPTDVLGTPDFYFRDTRIAVFVDGCFWHGCPQCCRMPKKNATYWSKKIRRNVRRDRRVDASLVSQRIRVLRVWEHEVTSRKWQARLRRLIRQTRICGERTPH